MIRSIDATAENESWNPTSYRLNGLYASIKNAVNAKVLMGNPGRVTAFPIAQAVNMIAARIAETGIPDKYIKPHTNGIAKSGHIMRFRVREIKMPKKPVMTAQRIPM